jgi:hypothetical protein
MASASLAYTLPLLLMVVAHGVEHHILLIGYPQVVHPMATALAYFLHPTQQLAVACQRRTKMLRFS